jgi:hypothetical protein
MPPCPVTAKATAPPAPKTGRLRRRSRRRPAIASTPTSHLPDLPPDTQERSRRPCRPLHSAQVLDDQSAYPCGRPRCGSVQRGARERGRVRTHPPCTLLAALGSSAGSGRVIGRHHHQPNQLDSEPAAVAAARQAVALGGARTGPDLTPRFCARSLYTKEYSTVALCGALRKKVRLASQVCRRRLYAMD